MSDEEDLGLIEEIQPRYSRLLRPPVVNIDILLIINAIHSPELQSALLDKYILMAYRSKIQPILVFTKADLATDQEIEYWKKMYQKIGISCYHSSRNKIPFEIKNQLNNKTTAVAGPSGAGKSTLLNALFGFNFETGTISDKTGRGKQTTRHIELKKIGRDSFIMDTPGFSSLSLDFIKEEEEIKNYFPEFQDKVCKFYNCNHLKEPSCGVKTAVEEGEISESRYQSYQLFFHEFKSMRR